MYKSADIKCNITWSHPTICTIEGPADFPSFTITWKITCNKENVRTASIELNRSIENVIGTKRGGTQEHYSQKVI